MAKKKDDQLEQRVAELENQLKRAVADYRNLEQRVSEGRSELTSFVGGELIKRLLPVLDHLEQALSGVSEEDKQSGWVKGVELAVKEFKSVLQQEGLDQIAADPSTSLGTGVQFDPALHEAVDVREMPPSLDSSGEPKDNMILEVVRLGYKLNGKVLRPTQVVVGKSASAEASADKEKSSIPGGETQSDFHIPLEEDKREES